MKTEKLFHEQLDSISCSLMVSSEGLIIYNFSNRIKSEKAMSICKENLIIFDFYELDLTLTLDLDQFRNYTFWKSYVYYFEKYIINRTHVENLCYNVRCRKGSLDLDKIINLLWDHNGYIRIIFSGSLSDIDIIEDAITDIDRVYAGIVNYKLEYISSRIYQYTIKLEKFSQYKDSF